MSLPGLPGSAALGIRFETWERTVAFSQRFRKPLGGLENDSFDIPETGVEPPGGLPGSGGITFDTWERTVAFLQRFGGDLASGKPPGGLENFDIPETGVEPLGASGECQCENQTAPTATYDT